MTRKCEVRNEAKVGGLVKYFTGAPCRKGHVAERYVSTGSCCDCVKTSRSRFAHTEKGIAYRRRWRSQPHIREKDRQYAVKFAKKWRYGLEWDEFLALLERAGNKCEICRKPFQPRSQRDGACIDHDHETRKVRGLLCHSCNRAMGLLQDDPAILRAMLEYLQR